MPKPELKLTPEMISEARFNFLAQFGEDGRNAQIVNLICDAALSTLSTEAFKPVICPSCGKYYMSERVPCHSCGRLLAAEERAAIKEDDHAPR